MEKEKFRKNFYEKFGYPYKTITFVADIRIFSCLFVKFVLYTRGVPWGGNSSFFPLPRPPAHVSGNVRRISI